MHRLTLFLSTLLMPFMLHAHGIGVSLEKTVDEYLVDIGYEPEELRAGEPVRFDFQLWNNDMENLRPMEFTAVAMKILDNENEEVVFETRIAKAPLGWTGMYVSFPEAGDYTLHATYQNGDEDVTEASFPLSVEAAASMWNPLAMSAILMMGSLIAGGLLATVGKKAMRR